MRGVIGIDRALFPEIFLFVDMVKLAPTLEPIRDDVTERPGDTCTAAAAAVICQTCACTGGTGCAASEGLLKKKNLAIAADPDPAQRLQKTPSLLV